MRLKPQADPSGHAAVGARASDHAADRVLPVVSEEGDGDGRLRRVVATSSSMPDTDAAEVLAWGDGQRVW